MLDFTENGIRYHAEKGFAFAEKDGKELWRALDVFTVSEPTKEGVIVLGNILGGASDGKTEQDDLF